MSKKRREVSRHIDRIVQAELDRNDGVKKPEAPGPPARHVTKRSKLTGFRPSLVETSQLVITLRTQQSRPTGRKPSMPKLPWPTKE